MLLAYDVETTGYIQFNQRSLHPGQPHMVELAAILVDDRRREVARLQTLVKPEGWSIPAAATAVHGITTERAMDEGRPIAEVIADLGDLSNLANSRVAYNEHFDRRMVRIELRRLGHSQDVIDEWECRPEPFCPQARMTKLCNIPPTLKMRRAGFYWPKTAKCEEAYQHLFGKPLEGAHGALADCEAVLAIWHRLQDLDAAESPVANLGVP